MGKARPTSRKRRTISLRVPGWYYTLLGGILLVGIILIAFGMRTPPAIGNGATEEGDYPLGSPAAPVTVIEWGNFT